MGVRVAHREGGRAPAVLHVPRRRRAPLRRSRRSQQPALHRRGGRRRGPARQPRLPRLLLLLPAPRPRLRRVAVPAGRRRADLPAAPLPTMSPFMGVPLLRPVRGQAACGCTTPTTPRCGRRRASATAGPSSGLKDRRSGRSGSGCAGPRTPSTSPPSSCRPQPGRPANTWLIDYRPVIEQCLADLADWVEHGIEPASTAFSYHDGSSPCRHGRTAGRHPARRRGHRQRRQPGRGEGRRAGHSPSRGRSPRPAPAPSSPPEWDFDGSGTYPFRHDGVDGTHPRSVWSRPTTLGPARHVLRHRPGPLAPATVT